MIRFLKERLGTCEYEYPFAKKVNSILERQIKELYDLGPDARKILGEQGRKWCLSSEAGFTAEHQGARVIEALDELFNTWETREVFEVIDTDEDIRKIQTHNLVY